MIAEVADDFEGVPDSGPVDSRRPFAVDLFAGAGGLSLGLEQAGFDVVSVVENDPVHCAVHSYNFPATPVICSDIGAVGPDWLAEAIIEGIRNHGRRPSDWDGMIDLIAGGPPCQGFSSIGKHLVEDKRNRLVFEFFRLVSQLRPRYFLMENVPGMLAGGHKSAILNLLISEFELAGYRVADPPAVLNAASYGVPQDRRRLFLIGAQEGLPLPKYPVPTAVPRIIDPSRPSRRSHATDQVEMGPSVWDAIGDLPDADQFPELVVSDETVLSDAIRAGQREAMSPYAARLNGVFPDPSDFSHPRTWDSNTLTSSRRTLHSEESVARFRAAARGRKEAVSRCYRLTVDGVSNTIRAGTGPDHGAYTSPRPIHPSRARVLTVREAARLHSFPDWFRLHGTKWHGFRQVGNAVPPLLARAVAAEIVEALGTRPTRPQARIELGSVELLWMSRGEAMAHFRARAGRQEPAAVGE